MFNLIYLITRVSVILDINECTIDNGGCLRVILVQVTVSHVVTTILDHITVVVRMDISWIHKMKENALVFFYILMNFRI